MVFMPFSTSHKPFVDVASLLESYGIGEHQVIKMALPQPQEDLNMVKVYFGKPSDVELLNFKGFMDYNQLQTPNGATYLWRYDVIVVVGFCGDVVVDVPPSMFPWPRLYYSNYDNPDIFLCPIMADWPPQHMLMCKCFNCTREKRACVPVIGMGCNTCAPGKCSPSSGEELARIRKCYDVMVSMSFALSPPYQHLIQSVKTFSRYNGEPKMSSRSRARLVYVVKELYRGAGSLAGEQLIKLHAHAHQVVCVVDGQMVVENHNMKGLYGFNANVHRHENKAKAASIVPHFGLPRFELAVSLVNNALQSPGWVFWLEDCVMYGSGFRTVRLMITARINSEHNMMFVVGWVFK